MKADGAKGRTEQERSDRVEDIATEDARRRGSGKSRHEGKHGDVQEQTMMEKVLARENLLAAWRRVKANAGAPGIDGMTVEEFPAFGRKHWLRLRSALMEGTYRPAPVRRVFIPKPDGTQRPLGVPTVLDRVIQQALAQVLTPLFEGGFSNRSYGFRESRNAHQAVQHVEACWKEGRRHAVDCDLKSFFDTVSHDRLMGQLREKIRDRKVLDLIRRYLQAGVVLPDGSWKQWKQPRTRRRHLLASGIPREEVRMATRSRKGYWRMSSNSIVQRALTNRWLHECAFAGGFGGTRQGVPTCRGVARRAKTGMRTLWIVLHYGPKARV